MNNKVLCFNTRLNKTKRKLIRILSSELSVKKVALTMALGVMYGIVPFFLMLNVFLCVITAWRFKLNHVLIQLVSNLVYPIQILMFVPFIKMGTHIFSSKKLELSSSFVLAIFKEDMIDGIMLFGEWILFGLLLWGITSVIMIPILYYAALTMVQRFNLVPKLT